MKRPKLYFSHPWEASDAGEVYHTKLEEHFIVINPFRKQKKTHPYFVVNMDLAMMVEADVVLVWLPVASVGCIFELVIASTSLRKPTYVVSKRYGNHPWIQYYAAAVFDSIDEFLTYAKEVGVDCP